MCSLSNTFVLNECVAKATIQEHNKNTQGLMEMVGNVLVALIDPSVTVSADEMALRRAAIAITAQLPTDLNDALRVLELARELVTDFLRSP